jgi:hypothetical protein
MLKMHFLLSSQGINLIKRGVCIAFIMLFFLCPSKAQIISTGINESKAFVISFNPSFIKDHKIRSITKHIANKPDNQMIIDRGLMEYYEFDKQGNQIYNFSTEIKSASETEVLDYTYNKKGKRIPFYKTEYSYLYDTTFTYCVYDTNNRLIIKRNSIIGREVFKSYFYEYDDNGCIKKESVIREVNAAENIRDFKTGMQTVLSVEGFTYESIAPGQVRKKVLNDEGRVYKQGIVYTDDKGHVTEEAFDYVVTWIKERNLYKYNSKGLLIEKKLSSNDGFSSNETYEHDPGETDVVNGIHFFKEGAKTKDISYIYDKRKFLDSEISRDHKSLSIGIGRYDYSYYE